MTQDKMREKIIKILRPYMSHALACYNADQILKFIEEGYVSKEELCACMTGQEHRLGTRIEMLEKKNKKLVEALKWIYDDWNWADSTTKGDARTYALKANQALGEK